MPGVRDWLGWREVGVAVGNGTRNPCDGTVLYLDCVGVYTIVCVCQKSYNCTLKRVYFTPCKLHTKKID